MTTVILLHGQFWRIHTKIDSAFALCCDYILISLPLTNCVHTEADPQGLHPLTALRWLERLLNKCRHAFRVQLDGTLCSRTPHHDEFLYRNNSHHDGEGAEVDAPDLAGKLVSATLNIAHPQCNIGVWHMCSVAGFSGLCLQLFPILDCHLTAASSLQAQAMYALRHPLLPTPPNTDNADSINVYLEALHNRQQTPIGNWILCVVCTFMLWCNTPP